MNRGKYIVLEGPEGVGKTTQLMELSRRLQTAGLPVRTLREPDSQSDLTARAIRQLTQDPRYPMNTNTEVLLYNAARSQSLQVIKRSVEQGVVCLVDRNYLTTLAIQYYGRGDIPDYETINRIIAFAVNGMEPDLTIVLDAPVPVLKERLGSRYHGERFDNLDSAFLERVRAGYLWEAKQRNLPVVFATDDSETVSENIWKLVAESLATRDGIAPGSSQPTALKDILEEKKLAAAPHEPPMEPTIVEEVAEAPNSPESPAAKDELGDPYDFFVPKSLDDTTAALYSKTLTTIVENMEKVLQQLAPATDTGEQIAELLLPVASAVGKDGTSGPLYIKRPLNSQLAAMANTDLQMTHGEAGESTASLIEFWPRSEFSVVPAILYPYSNLSLRDLKEQADEWSYDQKAAVLSSYNASEHPASQASVGYQFDVLTESAGLMTLQSLRDVVALHQLLTPRYGFEVPPAVTEAGLAELFESCFDASLELHSQLQAAGYSEEADYVTLLGHKQRITITMSGAAVPRLQKLAHGSFALQKLVPELLALVANVHPLLATHYQHEKQLV